MNHNFAKTTHQLWRFICENVMHRLQASSACIKRRSFRCSWSVTSFSTSFVRIRIYTDIQIDTELVTFFFFLPAGFSKFFYQRRPLQSLIFSGIWHILGIIYNILPCQSLGQIASMNFVHEFYRSDATRVLKFIVLFTNQFLGKCKTLIRLHY